MVGPARPGRIDELGQPYLYNEIVALLAVPYFTHNYALPEWCGRSVESTFSSGTDHPALTSN